MSTVPSSTAPGSSTPPAGAPRPHKREITLISHSMLFYWWPIWVMGFAMAAITYFEENRLVILPKGTTVSKVREDEKSVHYQIGIEKGKGTNSLAEAVD